MPLSRAALTPSTWDTGNFNARRNAVNFDEAALQEAVQYCHLRGVKVYLTLNTLLNDRELTQAAKLVDQVSQMGVDARWYRIWAWRGCAARWRLTCPSTPAPK